MPDRRAVLVAVLLVAALGLAACTSDSGDPSAAAADPDPTLLDVGQRREIGGDRSAAVLTFAGDVAVTDEVYEADRSSYAGAEVEVCGFGAERRRAFWRLTTSDGEVAPDAPLPPAAFDGADPAFDVYAETADGCLRGWIWFSVADGTEPVRLDWEGSDDTGWAVAG